MAIYSKLSALSGYNFAQNISKEFADCLRQAAHVNHQHVEGCPRICRIAVIERALNHPSRAPSQIMRHSAISAINFSVSFLAAEQRHHMLMPQEKQYHAAFPSITVHGADFCYIPGQGHVICVACMQSP